MGKITGWIIILSVLGCSSHEFSPPSEASNEVSAPSNLEQQESGNDVAEESVGFDEKQAQANEPVPVAGSFLSCQYPDGQMQNSTSLQVNCQLENINYQPMEVEAKFAKVASDGSKHPLQIVSFDRESWTWVLSEDMASLSYTTLLGEISIDGQGPFMFSDEIDDPVAMSLFSGFWLTSEPNNNAGGENCVEMVTQAGQTNHINFTGLNSGPLQRFNDVPCGIQRNFLCKNIDPSSTADKWLVSAAANNFSSRETACPEGFAFGVPFTSAEIMAVNAVIDASPELLSVWVAIQRNPEQLDQFQWLRK